MDEEVVNLLTQMNDGIQALLKAQQTPPSQPETPEPTTTQNEVSQQIEELTQMVSSLATGTEWKEPTDDGRHEEDKLNGRKNIDEEEKGFTEEETKEQVDYVADMIEL